MGSDTKCNCQNVAGIRGIAHTNDMDLSSQPTANVWEWRPRRRQDWNRNEPWQAQLTNQRT